MINVYVVAIVQIQLMYILADMISANVYISWKSANVL